MNFSSLYSDDFSCMSSSEDIDPDKVFCACFCKHYQHSVREQFTKDVVDWVLSSSKLNVTIVSIGSGGLLQEYAILKALRAKGITARFNCIDPVYEVAPKELLSLAATKFAEYGGLLKFCNSLSEYKAKGTESLVIAIDLLDCALTEYRGWETLRGVLNDEEFQVDTSQARRWELFVGILLQAGLLAKNPGITSIVNYHGVTKLFDGADETGIMHVDEGSYAFPILNPKAISAQAGNEFYEKLISRMEFHPYGMLRQVILDKNHYMIRDRLGILNKLLDAGLVVSTSKRYVPAIAAHSASTGKPVLFAAQAAAAKTAAVTTVVAKSSAEQHEEQQDSKRYNFAMSS